MRPFQIACDEKTGRVRSVKLYGQELLDPQNPSGAELLVNGVPLATRLYPDSTIANPQPTHLVARLKGERFVDFWTGAGLVIQREMGPRPNAAHPCFGLQYWIRRDHVDATQLPWHGPGGPGVEAPLWVDTLSLPNWNWKFWGDDTRMIFASAHSSGPSDEWGHVGYDNDVPEKVKQFLKSPWRRSYPCTMVIHGGLYYNFKTGHWLAITCRRSPLGYMLNLESAGQGVSYDFALHALFPMGANQRMPEIKFYYGETREQMMRWLAEYVTFYYQEPPEWVFKTHFVHGLAWDNQPTWTAQADYWEKLVDQRLCSGISYCLVTNRPTLSGTSPIGYEPDPNHGSIEEFRAMCHRLADKGIPLLIWMSHSGLLPGALDVDDDWFIRGIDGARVASWGSRDSGMFYVNPGHPGYIKYTKKWIRFYLEECRGKGIFFDCYGTGMPADFTPRSFMKYPGDTAVMAIRFMEEVYACVKECDPEAIVLGEGVSLDGPINIFSINTNPIRAIDGLGPRDWFLGLNQWSRKRIVIDQGPDFHVASGMCKAPAGASAAHQQFITKWLREKGGRDASMALPGDLSVMGNLLVVTAGLGAHGGFVPSATVETKGRDFQLPKRWQEITSLTEQVTGASFHSDGPGTFRNVLPGIYQMTT